MKKFIKRRLHEDLEYYHVGDASPESNEFELGINEIDMPTLSLAKNINISDEEKNQIGNLDWSDLIIDQKNETSPIHMSVDVPWNSNISEGIAVDLQIINDSLYQLHISLAPELRSLGLGFKIYKALIMTYGHLYSGTGRRQNTNEVPKIWNKLQGDSEISCNSSDRGNICAANANPHKQELLQMIEN